MALLKASILILCALIRNRFVVYHQPNVINAFVCFDKQNDSWPHNWIKLNPIIQDDIPILQTLNIPKINTLVLEYKLRFVYFDRSFGDSQWKPILNETFIAYNGYENITSIKLPNQLIDNNINNKRSDQRRNSTDQADLNTNIKFTVLTFVFILIIVAVLCYGYYKQWFTK